jgi:hypothetical protein
MGETEAKDRSVMEARIRTALEEFKPSGGGCKTKWLWPPGEILELAGKMRVSRNAMHLLFSATC